MANEPTPLTLDARGNLLGLIRVPAFALVIRNILLVLFHLLDEAQLLALLFLDELVYRSHS